MPSQREQRPLSRSVVPRRSVSMRDGGQSNSSIAQDGSRAAYGATRPERDGSHAEPKNDAHGQPRSRNHREARRAQQAVHTRQVRQRITRWREYGTRAFAVLMIVGGLVGCAFFARPTTSAVEMRNLTTFPEFTVESFLDGSYFSGLSLWYADTYPLREPMVAADHAIDGLFGINTGSGMVGGNVQADEIPVEATETDEQPAPVVIEPPADPPDANAVAEDIQNSIMNGVFVQDGAAYNIYYFSQYAADTYVTAMNTAAEKLDGVSTVYSLLVPMNCITLGEEQSKALGGSDQQQTLDYLRTRFDSRVKPVEIVDDIVAHRDEYLYFHTDHHWTQLGAYYAYEALCKEKGIEPVKYDDHRTADLGEIQGTFYDTVAQMGYVSSDELITYIPNGTNEMTFWASDGIEYDCPVIDEAAADWEPSMKYMAFISGDRPLSIIHNPKLSDGSSCLVVKDSYGCAFVPNLVDSYETVHVIDFREANRNICDYAKENNIQDVIFLNGTKIGLTDSAAETLLSEVS